MPNKFAKRNRTKPQRKQPFYKQPSFSRNETKIFQNTHLATGVSTAGEVFFLDFIPQSVTDGGRIGSKVIPLMIKMRLAYLYQDDYNVFKYWIVRCKGDTSTTVTDYFHGNALAGTPILSHINREAYEVLTEGFMQTRTQWNGTNLVGQRATKQINLKLNPKRMLEYNGATTTSPRRNGLCMIVISDSGAVAHPQAECSWELFYKDP